MSPDEQEASSAITQKIQARLETLKALHAQDAWFTQLQDRSPEATEAVLTWRALSHQTDAETMLGEAPKPTERRLTDLYRQVQQVITAAEEQEVQKYAYIDHNLIDTGDNWNKQSSSGHDWDNWAREPPAPDYSQDQQHSPDMH